MSPRLRTSLLAMVPFALLFDADRVEFTTQMYHDVSGIRSMQVSGDSAELVAILNRSHEATRGYDQDRLDVTSSRVDLSRSHQAANLNGIDDVDASALDVVRHPLSLKTVYHFRERITVKFTYNDAKERAAAPVTEFEYTLVMPGRVTQVGPPTAERIGNTVRWTFNAAQPDVELTATAEAWRWDLILVLLYVLGYMAYRLAMFLTWRARIRPRKI